MMKGQIAGLMRQAQQMQENMKKAQDALVSNLQLSSRPSDRVSRSAERGPSGPPRSCTTPANMIRSSRPANRSPRG